MSGSLNSSDTHVTGTVGGLGMIARDLSEHELCSWLCVSRVHGSDWIRIPFMESLDFLKTAGQGIDPLGYS